MHIEMLSDEDYLADELALVATELPPAFLGVDENDAMISNQPNTEIPKHFADLRSYLDHVKTPLLEIAQEIICEHHCSSKKETLE